MAIGQPIDTLNGAHQAPAADISFGPLDHQLLSAPVASMLLTLFRERNPSLFGGLLAEVMTGARPSSRKPRGL